MNIFLHAKIYPKLIVGLRVYGLGEGFLFKKIKKKWLIQPPPPIKTKVKEFFRFSTPVAVTDELTVSRIGPIAPLHFVSNLHTIKSTVK